MDHDDTSLPGAERSVRFTISSFVFVERGLPVDVRSYRPDAVQFSPYLPHDSRPPPPPQGEAWDRIGRLKGVPASPASPSGVVTAAAGVVISGAAVGQQQGGQVQQLLRDVECVAVQDAAEGIKSFTFRLPPHLGGEAVTSGQPPFLPGRFRRALPTGHVLLCHAVVSARGQGDSPGPAAVPVFLCLCVVVRHLCQGRTGHSTPMSAALRALAVSLALGFHAGTCYTCIRCCSAHLFHSLPRP